MVVIRLARGGAKKRPFYSLVAADSRSKRDGRFIEKVGFYNPLSEKSFNDFKISVDRIQYWLKNGAQLSPSVKRLFKKFTVTASNSKN
ncbi:MAG: 30S ribosomal protein S16 [Bordetella sp.]|nr:MAG: 30S ribosomal protein S16 [Bordetella sp.]